MSWRAAAPVNPTGSLRGPAAASFGLVGDRRLGTSIAGLVVLAASAVASQLWRRARQRRAAAESALRASEARFRALTLASSEVLYRMSPDWSEMRQLDGTDFLAKTEAPTRSWLDKYIHPDDQAQVTAAIQKAIATRSIFQLEHRVLQADGSVGWTSSRAVPLLGSDGEIVEWFGAANDITVRKRNEEALREANQKSQELDRRKDEFLAVLSHELRNPLTPIRNSVYVLEHAPAGAEAAARAIEVIKRQTQYLTRLIDDLLDVTRLARGRITLQRERLDLEVLARETAEDHRQVFERAGVSLLVVGAGEPLWVDGDATRLSQLFGSLLSNAAKFTPRGGAARLSLQVSADRSAVIEVRDDGAGIPPETQRRLFEPFGQAAQPLHRPSGGLGLGLVIARGVAELHGGTIAVSSPGEGQGSVFTVTLPREHATAQARPVPQGKARAPSRRVLVVEDNEDAAQSLREALELSGHQVEVAFTGPAGLALARSSNPEILLCDLGLPELDGYGVAQAIRGDPELRSTYLVALSGYSHRADITRATDAGFDRHLVKPTSIETLERVFEEAFAHE